MAAGLGLRWIKRVVPGLSVLLVVVLAARYFPGSRPPAPSRFEVLAHRGVHQTSAIDVGMSGCSAAETVAYLKRLDRPEGGAEILEMPIDGVVTDRIEVIGPWLKGSGRIS